MTKAEKEKLIRLIEREQIDFEVKEKLIFEIQSRFIEVDSCDLKLYGFCPRMFADRKEKT